MKQLLIVGLLTTCIVGVARAQVIQFTGLVVSGDSLVGVPDARVSVLHTRRHTITAPNGYFSLPVLAGDSLEVRTFHSATRLRIPLDYPRTSYSLLVQLQPDARPATLRTLAAGFSQRFLDLKLPPPPTVATPPVSAKGLLLPIYDKKGRRIN